ncbi:hypothetical protein HaLaN_05096 [Haematococcus lacustris]|uniref:Uncharacterized protein n=1 Tax=Haematococcus lacustris TaxID=44745 RepID=A0A699YK61_HAELA|nr:hypothetical protein HaLaN_05096 [Haematococcus lacustris]
MEGQLEGGGVGAPPRLLVELSEYLAHEERRAASSCQDEMMLCGNTSTAQELRSWLEKKARRGGWGSSDEDFIVDDLVDGSDSSQEDAEPPGLQSCGNALELGFQVIEVNAGMDRGGAQLLRLVGEATQSRRLPHQATAGQGQGQGAQPVPLQQSPQGGGAANSVSTSAPGTLGQPQLQAAPAAGAAAPPHTLPGGVAGRSGRGSTAGGAVAGRGGKVSKRKLSGQDISGVATPQDGTDPSQPPGKKARANASKAPLTAVQQARAKGQELVDLDDSAPQETGKGSQDSSKGAANNQLRPEAGLLQAEVVLPCPPPSPPPQLLPPQQQQF